jgi:TPR repeat protein
MQDYKEAVRLYRQSAKQGNVLGQKYLGVMYAVGQGVSKDYIFAHMWWNICGSNGDKDCVKNINLLESKMSPIQIEKAQEMARNWKSTKKCMPSNECVAK